MKKIILLSCALLLSILNLSAQEFSIGDSSTISLITCSPGPEVYAKFGHTAIRVKDPVKGIDVVFNYGIFSFETEDFYYKFIKGETDYQLGVYDTNVFLPEYAERNSMVWEQILNLSQAEKQGLLNKLLENYEPQNRIYRYNFVFDNCSTRPRDKIISTLNGFVEFPALSEPRTFRQWIGVYVGTDTWLKFGIDLLFGLDADKVTTKNESMFLPEVLMSEFQSAKIVSPDVPKRNLVKERVILVNKTDAEDEETSWVFKPMTISIILLIIGTLITVWDVKHKRYFKPFDTVLLLITGVGGIIVFYLAFFSVHPLVKSNLNLLWLNPLNFILAILIWFKRFRKGLFFYQLFNILLLVGALLAFALSKQVFNAATFPLIVLLLMRTTSWVAVTKRRLFKKRS